MVDNVSSPSTVCSPFVSFTAETVSLSPSSDTSLYAAGSASDCTKPYFSVSAATSSFDAATGYVTPRILPLSSLYVPATIPPSFHAPDSSTEPTALFFHLLAVADDTASTS